jgi:hypothetical protein
MATKYFWRVTLIGILAVALCTNLAVSAEATDTLKQNADNFLAVAITGTAAAVFIVVLVVHESVKKHTITGCVNSGESGTSVTDEKDKHVYVLSGDTSNVKPGERMTLQGKKIKPNDGKPLIWETKKITKDFGSGHCGGS